MSALFWTKHYPNSRRNKSNNNNNHEQHFSRKINSSEKYFCSKKISVGKCEYFSRRIIFPLNCLMDSFQNFLLLQTNFEIRDTFFFSSNILSTVSFLTFFISISHFRKLNTYILLMHALSALGCVIEELTLVYWPKKVLRKSTSMM